ncbi:MAG: hypothetical protein Q9M76_05840 [Candidatus Dojkabacteria bacterium]|nr:hypothetical protein [Candidatus Dojkabacteria bacterium]
MEILILRSLITALVEYFLAYKIWTKGLRYKKPATGILFFLASLSFS